MKRDALSGFGSLEAGENAWVSPIDPSSMLAEVSYKMLTPRLFAVCSVLPGEKTEAGPGFDDAGGGFVKTGWVACSKPGECLMEGPDDFMGLYVNDLQEEDNPGANYYVVGSFSYPESTKFSMLKLLEGKRRGTVADYMNSDVRKDLHAVAKRNTLRCLKECCERLFLGVESESGVLVPDNLVTTGGLEQFDGMIYSVQNFVRLRGKVDTFFRMTRERTLDSRLRVDAFTVELPWESGFTVVGSGCRTRSKESGVGQCPLYRLVSKDFGKMFLQTKNGKFVREVKDVKYLSLVDSNFIVTGK